MRLVLVNRFRRDGVLTPQNCHFTHTCRLAAMQSPAAVNSLVAFSLLQCITGFTSVTTAACVCVSVRVSAGFARGLGV